MLNIRNHQRNANQNHNEEWPASINQQTYINKSTNKRADKDGEKGESFCTVGGNADWCSHCEKPYGDTSKN